MALPDIAAYSDYGGEKNDYAAPEDPTVDRAASELNPAFADVSAMTRTAPRAIVEFRSNAGAMVLISHDSVWGNGVSVAPTLAYEPGAFAGQPGHYSVTWPTTVVDARGVTHSVNLRWGVANSGDGGFNGYFATCSRFSPNVFYVHMFSGVDAKYEDSDAPIQLVVW